MKNIGKKSLVTLMAVSTLVPVMSAEVSASTPNAESDFEFSDGVITKYVGTNKDVVIPSSIGGVDVTSIGFSAFSFSSLTSITIPETVTSIGTSAFAMNPLISSVTIPNSVTSIGDYAFQQNSLTSLIIPESVTSIGSGAFTNNSLTSITIPDNVTSLGGGAFSNNSLTSVTIGNGLNSIGYNPFGINKNLNNIKISKDNPHFTSTDSDNAIYTIDGKELITGTESINHSMLDTLTIINMYAFNGNPLTTVTIPDSVTSIKLGAFQNNSLTSVTIPESVTSIGNDAFKPSLPLTTADVPIKGIKGSQAETYATTNGHPFNALPEPNEHSQEATLNLFGGTLSLDVPLFESFGTVELQSNVQVVTSNFMDSFKVFDARGTGEGWRLDVTSTQMEMVEPEEGFKEGTSTHVLPVGTLALDPLESIEPFNGSNGILPSPILDTTSIIDDGAITIAKADVGEGMGAFELTFGEGAFSATIDPSTAKIDKINYPDSDTPYEATVTWTLVSAP